MTMEQANEVFKKLGKTGVAVILLDDEKVIIQRDNMMAISKLDGKAKEITSGFGFSQLKYRCFKIPRSMYV